MAAKKARVSPQKRAAAKKQSPVKKRPKPTKGRINSKNSATRTLYASFVGINKYPQRPLEGCVRDVVGMDRMLRDLVAQQDDILYKAHYLLAPNDSDNVYLEKYKKEKGVTVSYKAPTFTNVTTKAFAHFADAKENDICVFFYSGHGSYIDSPKEFWNSKPDRKNETMVCVDSRNGKGRDIVDVEIGYLLWNSLAKKKGVHCLVITDACHSGGMTREVKFEGGIRYRFEPAPAKDLPLKQYLGYDQNFYKVVKGQAKISVARYVQLAACRDSELAQESMDGGLFTRKLLDMLRQGAGKSYRELMRVLGIAVAQVSGQNPVAFAREENDLDFVFLGNGMKPFLPVYPVRYDAKTKRWTLYAGQLHGLPAQSILPSIVRISGNGSNLVVNVDKVLASASLLAVASVNSLDKTMDYDATIVTVGIPPLVAKVSDALRRDVDKLTDLQKATEHMSAAYCQIKFKKDDDAEYTIQITDDNNYAFTKRGSDMPLFKREATAGIFLDQVNAVGKWLNVLNLRNTSSPYTAADFDFTFEKIEGIDLNTSPTNGIASMAIPEQENIARYMGDQQPAFRFSVSLSKTSRITSCYAAALMLGSRFGIQTSFFGTTPIQLVRGGAPTWMRYNDPRYNIDTDVIPLSIKEAYRALGVNEIVDYVKIIVSAQTFDVQALTQEGLALELVNARSRDIGIDRSSEDNDAGAWAAFTFPIRTIGPNRSKDVAAGDNNFEGFTLNVPAGLRAKVVVATSSDRARILDNTGMRNLDAAIDRMAKNLDPSPIIWGDDVVTSDQPLGGAGTQGGELIALEFLPATPNGPSPSLALGEELVLSPKTIQGASRAVDELESTVVPFGYDETKQLYFPLGYADTDGNIHITQLPPPSEGTFDANKPLTRSLGGSIKLFFKKIFRRRQDLNTLVLYTASTNGTWEKLTDRPDKMKALIPATATKSVLLLVHGIIGDTKYMCAALQAEPDVRKTTDFMLTYDYENLSTPIATTAEHLAKSLAAAGFGGTSERKLAIVAHSMGGLVSRVLIQRYDASRYVSRFIMLGVPNGGSQLSTVSQSVVGMLSHALNVTGPIKLAITGLCFVMKKLSLDPLHTLSKEMDPNSDFIVGMRTSKLPASVKPALIGGDVNLLKDKYDGDDFFLKRLAEALEKDVLYPGLTTAVFNNSENDMAVTLDSMKDIVNFSDITDSLTVASNHISYFNEGASKKALLRLLTVNGHDKKKTK